MSLLIWNCRELGNQRAGKELEVVVWAKNLSTVLLAETWADEARLKEIKRNLEFDNLFFERETTELEDWLYIGETQLICL